MFRLPYRSMACFPADEDAAAGLRDARSLELVDPPHTPGPDEVGYELAAEVAAEHRAETAYRLGLVPPEVTAMVARRRAQVCRQCLQTCIPAVTLTFGGGARRLHWCADHAFHADQYRATADHA